MPDNRPFSDEAYNTNEWIVSVDPATQSLLKFIEILISTMKGNANKVISKVTLSKYLRRGWQMTVELMIHTISKMANHIMEKDEFSHTLTLLKQCALSGETEDTCNCASFNDLENLDFEMEPLVYQQWQMVSIPPPRRRSYSHLQQLWKKQAHSSSRCQSRTNVSPPSHGSHSLDDDELDDLDCERFSQVSGSAITALNVGPNAHLDMQQQLAALQEQLAMVVQLQQQQLQQQLRALPTNAPPVDPLKSEASSSFAVPIIRKTPPPPAPPPPPPDFFRNFSAQTVRKASSNTFISLEKVEKPSLMEVLKDISNVKLKKVEVCRSPNGTPMRHSSDLRGQFLAQALKEQFRNVRPIESDDDTDSNSNGAWDEEAEA